MCDVVVYIGYFYVIYIDIVVYAMRLFQRRDYGSLTVRFQEHTGFDVLHEYSRTVCTVELVIVRSRQFHIYGFIVRTDYFRNYGYDSVTRYGIFEPVNDGVPTPTILFTVTPYVDRFLTFNDIPDLSVTLIGFNILIIYEAAFLTALRRYFLYRISAGTTRALLRVSHVLHLIIEHHAGLYIRNMFTGSGIVKRLGLLETVFFKTAERPVDQILVRHEIR